MTRRSLSTDAAPAAIGPYSQGIDADPMIYTSGQLGIDPRTGELVAGGIGEEARRALDNLGAVLAAAGVSYADVVKTTVFLADISDFAALNDVYGSYFSDSPPARSTFAVAALPKGGRVEIEAIAVRQRV